MPWAERYVRADADGTGNGTTDANSGANGSWTLTQAIANVVAGNRVNIKGVTIGHTGVYPLSASLTMSVAGTLVLPIHWRGFKDVIGDLDTETDHTTFPHFNVTGGSWVITVSGAHNWVSSIHITSDVTTAGGQAIFWNSTGGVLFHCHIVATANDADGHAITLGGFSDGSKIFNNYFQSTATAAATVELQANATQTFITGNYISGGSVGVIIGSFCVFNNNIVTGPATGGIYCSQFQTANITNNSIHSTGTYGVRFNTGVAGGAVKNNIFSSIGSYAVTHDDANEKSTLVTNNAYWSVGTAQLQNIYEQFNAINCAASPFVNVGAGDFTPTAEVKALGFPSRVGLASTLNYQDIGAIQAQAIGGGGGIGKLFGKGLIA